MDHMQKGSFIVIDGTDGSGKGTQAKKLIERIQASGRAVELMDFPRYGNPSAYFVEKYLRGEYGSLSEIDAYRASLFYALDRYDASHDIRAKLNAGTIIVSNRYVSANKGHQMAKIQDPAQRKEFLAWLNELEYVKLGIPKPDQTIFLHVPYQIGYELVAQKDMKGYLDGKIRDIHESDKGHLQSAELAYLALPELDAEEHWSIVECTQDGKLLSIEEIHERLWQHVTALGLSSSIH